MFEIGLTGGIGSGKSTVARIFESLGYAVYYADDRAKAMYAIPEVEAKVRAVFGDEVYQAPGKLNKKALAGIVFKDAALLQQLNGIIHPATLHDYEVWRDALLQHYDRPFLLKEAAILLEAGSNKDLHAVLTIYAPKSVRIARVCSRDDANRSQVLDRMNKQWPDARKIHAADFVIYNDGQHAVIPQVMDAVRYFRKRAAVRPL
ncbi:MAG: dephospho-CoA kinase [Bacteroidota bacterium]